MIDVTLVEFKWFYIRLPHAERLQSHLRMSVRSLIVGDSDVGTRHGEDVKEKFPDRDSVKISNGLQAASKFGIALAVNPETTGSIPGFFTPFNIYAI